ncbi:hypothetical protein GCM10027570_33490 [Streptomonospora sediminis]
MTTSLAVFAALAGLAGLALGAWALVRTRSVVSDCRDLVHRLLPDGSGLDARAVRDIAVVRYDALEEMSGARSFSLALLNSGGDGVVVTAINGRTESRTYAKTIRQGRATEALSPEEYRSIRAARLGQGLTDKFGEGASAPAPAPRSAAGDLRPEADSAAAAADGGPAGESAPAADPGTSAVRPLGTATTRSPASGAPGTAE